MAYRPYKVIESNGREYIFEYTKKIIRPKDVLWNVNSITFSSERPEKFLLAFSDLLDYEMTIEKNVCKFGSLWFCSKNKSGIVSLPIYVQICTKFGTLVHWYVPSGWFFICLKFFSFLSIFFVFMRPSIFEVDYRPCSNRMFIGFMG